MFLMSRMKEVRKLMTEPWFLQCVERQEIGFPGGISSQFICPAMPEEFCGWSKIPDT
jgi:hypothetical protein